MEMNGGMVPPPADRNILLQAKRSIGMEYGQSDNGKGLKDYSLKLGNPADSFEIWRDPETNKRHVLVVAE